MRGPVAIPALVIIVAFVLFAMITPDTAKSALETVQNGVTNWFSWYYVVLVSAFVVFAIWVGVSHFGDIKLGPDDEKPEFGLFAWFAMLFAAGMGIGLVFWGVAEPLNHYAGPKPGVEGSKTELAQQGLVQSFLHWGLHPWAIYVVVGLAVAYAVHRKNRPISIRWTLEPLFGDRVKGWIGDVIDVAAIVGTLFGVATSLGLGVMQISAGLDFLGLVQVADDDVIVRVVLIALITGIATISVVTGVAKGIKWLSNFNMGIAGFMLLFVLIAGPTIFILREFIQSIGFYLQNLLQLSFDITAMQVQGDPSGSLWQSWWTVFYWGWWISWAPFVGVFIARISRGRTVREFVAGVLLVPTLVGFLWFAVFGGAALYREVFTDNPMIGETWDDTRFLFTLLDGLPLSGFISLIAIVVVAVFFITSSDSASLVVDMLASGGDTDPPRSTRVLWAVLEGVVAAALLIAGGGGQDALLALRAAAIIIALPFSVVMIAICIALWRQFHAEREAMVRVQRHQLNSELTEEVSQSLLEEGIIEEPPPEVKTRRKRQFLSGLSDRKK